MVLVFLFVIDFSCLSVEIIINRERQYNYKLLFFNEK